MKESKERNKFLGHERICNIEDYKCPFCKIKLEYSHLHFPNEVLMTFYFCKFCKKCFFALPDYYLLREKAYAVRKRLKDNVVGYRLKETKHLTFPETKKTNNKKTKITEVNASSARKETNRLFNRLMYQTAHSEIIWKITKQNTEKTVYSTGPNLSLTAFCGVKRQYKYELVYKDRKYIAPDHCDLLRKNILKQIQANSSPKSIVNSKKKNAKRETIDASDKIVVVHVFKGKLRVPSENIERYNLIVGDFTDGFKYELPVYYDVKNDIIYLAHSELMRHQEKCHFLQIKIKLTNKGSERLNFYDDFNEVSILKLYGYAAGKNGLSTNARQGIISFIIDNNIMTDYEIVRHLQSLISLRGGRYDRDFSQAIEDWEEDIVFTDRYHLRKNIKTSHKKTIFSLHEYRSKKAGE